MTYGADGTPAGGNPPGNDPRHGLGNPPRNYPPMGATPPPGGPPPGYPQAGPPPPGTPAQPSAEQQRPRSRAPWFLVGALVIALASGLVGGLVGAGIAGREGSSAQTAPFGGQLPSVADPAEEAPRGSVQWAAERVLPSVVKIDVDTVSASGSGSGVILSSDGVILTNNHVVAGSDGTVDVAFNDGSVAPGRVIAGDAQFDIAVVQVEGRTDLTPVEIGSSGALNVGQPVVAIGSPLGLSATVTTGIVSALNRPVYAGGETAEETSVIDAIQTDAAINPGNSGGALVNLNGELVGVNTAIATLGRAGMGQGGSIGLGFSIPIDQAKRVADELLATGEVRKATLGVLVDMRDPERGALVTEIVPDGAAEQAGIPPGAVVVGLDDRPITTATALIAAVRSQVPGDVVEISWIPPDGGALQRAQVELREG
ncbi:trypsin-like peptidase domain-containing protein [Hoyosella sp. G463]|uniref:Trypsin-like peptidase domain-containing protein n=1 Tax=Lolliginicoccus lacisalsi TaxID=2742202 RepID=A0A927JBA4_9ACTN|nr:trypsin-like peptidase domain-containing protein [Lolliginicoccus lacisalsi]MBD8506096.1 trypsin-like peptidase domain-containing protein [Lolliginicoccus lacisalsi]